MLQRYIIFAKNQQTQVKKAEISQFYELKLPNIIQK